jgi:hypothetical protein
MTSLVSKSELGFAWGFAEHEMASVVDVSDLRQDSTQKLERVEPLCQGV